MTEDRDIKVNGKTIGQIDKIETDPKKMESVYELPASLKDGVLVPGRMKGTLPIKRVKLGPALVARLRQIKEAMRAMRRTFGVSFAPAKKKQDD